MKHTPAATGRSQPRTASHSQSCRSQPSSTGKQKLASHKPPSSSSKALSILKGAYLDTLLVRLGVAQGGGIHGADLVNLRLRAVTHKHGLATPLEGHVLAWSRGERSEGARRRGCNEAGDWRLGTHQRALRSGPPPAWPRPAHQPIVQMPRQPTWWARQANRSIPMLHRDM